MVNTSKHISFAGLLATLLSGTAVAQAPPPPWAAPGLSQALLALGQLPETRGVVREYTLTPRGDLDGFLLTDGTDVHVPPHLSAQLAAAIRPGDGVAVRGYRAGSAPLVVAAAITNAATNEAVIDRGPPPPGFGPPPPPPPGFGVPGALQSTLSGKVLASLYGPAGDLNGAALEDGTIVRLPPPVAYQSANLLAPGQVITVQGWLVTTSYGRVVETQAVSPTIAQTSVVAPPPPPAARQ